MKRICDITCLSSRPYQAEVLCSKLACIVIEGRDADDLVSASTPFVQSLELHAQECVRTERIRWSRLLLMPMF